MPRTPKSLSLVALTLATALFVSACQRVGPAGIPSAEPTVTDSTISSGQTLEPTSSDAEPPTGKPDPSNPQTQPGPESELVAIASSHARTNPKAQLGAVRIADNESLDTFLDSYASGDDDALTAELRSQISEVPDGKVLVGGVVSIGCDIPGSAVLIEQGEKFALLADILPTEPTPECVVANMTVAIVATDFAEIPGGSTSFGDLVHFASVTTAAADSLFPLELTSSDTEFLAALDELNLNVPELPALPSSDRRFAFLLTGCANDAAELHVTAATISAGLTSTTPPESLILCDAPENYLAVIDVASDLVPAEATLAMTGKYRSDTIELQQARSFDGPDALEITDDPELIQQTWGIDAELVELAPDTRRFAFLLYGCQDDWADLIVTPDRIFAILGNNRPAGEQINCAVADIYLATFDVPAADIPATAELSGE